ncbi:MAG: peptidylprolyl isomerase [Endozoicomonadaceae bacterium]|nr:peptidylprolyl isomerase [Endozoicomonadaceae bacterium]
MITCLLLSGTSNANTQENTTATTASHSDNVLVDINTTQGNITLKLNKQQSPETVRNFLKYSAEGFYHGTIFHRVIANFMIQGGGMTANMKKKSTHEPIPNESRNGLSNRKGTIAMARASDPNSATSQFFINLKDNKFLDGTPTKPGYTVFGEVVSGMNVVAKIGKTHTTQKGSWSDIPTETITINNITLHQ